jgi:sugar lactone lactonase YvrE
MNVVLKFFVALLLLFCAGSVFAQVSVSEIPYDSPANFLKFPDHIYFGEVYGVATNSKGNLFVYNWTGETAKLFEFDPAGKFVREIGKDLYGFIVPASVRVDAQDNVWTVDEGANNVVRFSPDGRVTMVLGRKGDRIPVPVVGNGAGAATDDFNRPTDIAFDSSGNFFVSDGRGNSRIAKFDKRGIFVKSWGTKGNGPGQFNMASSIAVDAQGNVYVADTGNRRIQVFDNNGTFKTQYQNIGGPRAVCISSGAHQYLFSSNSNAVNSVEGGEIYKMELDGRILGKFGKAGKLPKEFGSVNAIDCRNANELYVGEVINWRVQKISLRAN